MRSIRTAGFTWLAVVGICSLLGCGNTKTELDLTTYDRLQDQDKIAEVYSQKAERLRYMAREQFQRAAVYEHLFGAGSDWVAGTRLLAQSYENAAKEQDRRAEQHRDLARGARASKSVGPVSH
ncbi:MAG: hypothetical protein OJF47_004187 [Nitrospira sp.]|jgi:hypothetical protein|nr:MAG: hypothetical protein OJF47_004187 [Nitrospira sp.]